MIQSLHACGCRPPEAAALGPFLELLPVPGYACDLDGRIVAFNAEAVRLWGRAPAPDDDTARYCGAYRLYLSDGAPIAHNQCWMALAIRRGVSFHGREIIIENAAGERRIGLAHASPLRDGQGRVYGAVNIVIDVTAQKAVEATLQSARAAAETGERAKAMFITAMSHEIRTPLTGVLGMAEVLLGTPLTDQQHDCADLIRKSGDALLTLLNDILDLATIEADAFSFDYAAFDLDDLMREAVDAVSAEAALKGLSLRRHIDPALLGERIGDPRRVRQVFANLLGNAVKFTDRGVVAFTAEPAENGRVRFYVADTGPGVREADRECVFDRFRQAEEGCARRFNGAGLGLALCKEIVERAGGEIGVEGVFGEGATFWFELPLPPAAGEIPAADQAVMEAAAHEAAALRLAAEGADGADAAQATVCGEEPCELDAPALADAGRPPA